MSHRNSDPTRPNFFIVGAAKCGTTSMYEYLRQHPDIFMPDYKEPVYFGRDLGITDCWRVPQSDKYLALFKPGAGRQRIGESTVWYICSQEAAAEIKAFAPEARIIVMLRNPVDFLYSLHGLFLWSDNEDLLDFEQAFDAQADRAAGRRIPPQAYFVKGLQYTQMATFSTQVQRYYDAFGRESVLVILQDDLKNDVAGVYRRVRHHLQIDENFAPDFTRFNETRPIAQLPFHRLINRPIVRGVLQKTLTKMSKSTRGKLVDGLTRLVRPKARPTRIDPVLRAKLLPLFHDEIDALARVIGRDLSHWKSPAAEKAEVSA